mmetsp:Transcript_12267/g.31118  ORF Transcript_12267/g.31118 Transcript_12267/m.31118 type:complete len:505 (-) Transcript_12267:48-1562(-)
MAAADPPSFPCESASYQMAEALGYGASSVVNRAICLTNNQQVAVKRINLEKSSADIAEIRNELHTLELSRHANLVESHRAFVSGSELWIVMEYMAGGSALDLMKYKYHTGFTDEHLIATILKGALQGIEYLHKTGRIHRDVKAGNILINSVGEVKLGDFGVAGLLNEGGERKQNRQTFVGTPCWMAPEVMEQVHGYDFRADIWSFGITAIELARGQAPLAKHPPMKVLLLTLQNPPPTLAGDDPKCPFSKPYRDLVSLCLVKEPEGRPTATKLLEHRFFKSARKPDYVVQNLLDGLPDLSERAATIHQKALSVPEPSFAASAHRRGISGQWIFPTEEEESSETTGFLASVPASEATPASDGTKKGRFVLSSVETSAPAPAPVSQSADAGSEKKGRFIVSPAAGDASSGTQAVGSGDIDGKKARGGRTVGDTIKTLLQKSRQHTTLLQGIQQTLTQQQQQQASLSTSAGGEDALQLVDRLRATIRTLLEENQRLRQENATLKGGP